MLSSFALKKMFQEVGPFELFFKIVFFFSGRSSLFPIEDGFLDDGHGDQTVPGVLNSVNCCSSHQNGERIERYSRKVFVGGLPPDIDEGSAEM